MRELKLTDVFTEKIRLECYGNEYNPNSPECQNCPDRNACLREMEGLDAADHFASQNKASYY